MHKQIICVQHKQNVCIGLEHKFFSTNTTHSRAHTTQREENKTKWMFIFKNKKNIFSSMIFYSNIIFILNHQNIVHTLCLYSEHKKKILCNASDYFNSFKYVFVYVHHTHFSFILDLEEVEFFFSAVVCVLEVYPYWKICF